MGIQGLIPFLKKSARPISLSQFQNQVAAVDAYGWLHKGAFSCADKLVKGETTSGYIYYMMKQINLLLSFNIKPILVFDGCHLPSKAVTELKRRENRKKNRRKAEELLREGKKKEAQEYFQRCVEVTSVMAHEVIKACRQRNIDIIVAPYEADAQLAYLNINKFADFVITEDSDLVVFGCSKIIFKMDNNGGGLLIEKEKLHMSMGVSAENFCFDNFVRICVLSGCDYLPSLHGIGLAKAKKFFQLTTNKDSFSVLKRLPTYLKMPQLDVTLEYREGFMRAINTIRYQLVFDPTTTKLRPLNDYLLDFGSNDYPYCGEFMGHQRALQIALGNVDVQNGETVDNFHPNGQIQEKPKSSGWQSSNTASSHPSIWQKNYKLENLDVKPKSYSPPKALNVTTGKTVTVKVCLNKRKRDDSTEEAISDIDITNLYKTPKLLEEASQSAIEESNYHESEALTEANSPILPSRRTNPFGKSPQSSSVGIPSSQAKVFSGLRNFSTEASSVRTVVKGRYFSPGVGTSEKKSTVLQTLEVLDQNETVNQTAARKLTYDDSKEDAMKEEPFVEVVDVIKVKPITDDGNTPRISVNPFKRSTPSFSWKGVSVMDRRAKSPPLMDCITGNLPDSPPITQQSEKENSPKGQLHTSIYFESALTPPQDTHPSSSSTKLFESHKKSTLSQGKTNISKTPKNSCRQPGLSLKKKQPSIMDMFAFKKNT